MHIRNNTNGLFGAIYISQTKLMEISYKTLMHPTLNCIVINWNTEAASLLETLDCIDKAVIHAQRKGLIGAASIHLWDNKSLNFQTPNFTAETKVIVSVSEENLGFAVANNRAAQSNEDFEWLWLVNPDITLEETALSHILLASRVFTSFEAYGFSQVSYPAKDKWDGLGDVVHASGLCWRDGFGKYRIASNERDHPYETFASCGAATLIKRDIFESLGGFDEDFFCYQEDIDLCFRLRLMGHRVLQVPQAVVYHVGSQSTGGHRSDFSVYHGRRNLVWCYVKNMPGILFWLFLPLHLLLNVVDLVYFSLHGQAGVIWRAKWDAIKGLPKMWRKRQVIQAQRVASIGQIWRALDKRLWPFNFKAIRARSGRRFE